MRDHTRAAVLAGLLVAGTAAAAYAQIAISANDAKVKLVNGKVEVAKSPPADTVTFIDLGPRRPRCWLRSISQTASSVRPRTSQFRRRRTSRSVASSMQIDPADPTKQIPDDRLTVIDLSPLKPGLVSRLRTAWVLLQGRRTGTQGPHHAASGQGRPGVSFNKAGTLALVANRAEGTVSVFTVSGTTVTPAGKVTVGKQKSRPEPRRIRARRQTRARHPRARQRVVVLSVDGNKVDVTKREIAAACVPMAIDVAAKGEVAVVANIGDYGQRRRQHHQHHRPQARAAARGQQLQRRRRRPRA